jgi:hypothetical protein
LSAVGAGATAGVDKAAGRMRRKVGMLLMEESAAVTPR